VAAVLTAFTAIGDSWWQLIIAGALGVLLAQFGFLGHDAAHRQIFLTGRANDRAALVLGTLFSGMSLAWWNSKHNRHHAAPNQIGKDPDIDPTVLLWYPTGSAPRSRLGRFLRERQGWWFFPLLTLEGANLHIQSFRTSLRRNAGKRRWVEITVLTTRWSAYLTVLLLVLDPQKAAAFLGVQLAVVGVYLGCTFAPNHKGMPVLPPEARPDFLHRQVLTSRNIRGNRLTTLAMGGLNYQIEHHLFPSMPRANLQAAQPVVRRFCETHRVPYAQSGALASYAQVLRHLSDVAHTQRQT
jgi:fatty acid desaturase